MKWLTIEQGKKHATTPTKALNISIKHWQQIDDLTEEECKQEIGHEEIISAFLCGLCRYYDLGHVFRGCDKCLIVKKGGHISCYEKESLYRSVYNKYVVWEVTPYCKTFAAFKKEARKMLKFLKSLKGAKK